MQARLRKIILYAVVVFLSSALLLVLEIVAARLIAPYVGVSLYTWSAVIGVVLAVLPAGLGRSHFLVLVFGHVAGQPFAPVAVGGVDTDTIAPPAMGDFMPQARAHDKGQTQHPATDQCIRRKTETSREKIFHNSKFRKGIRTEQIRVKGNITGRGL